MYLYKLAIYASIFVSILCIILYAVCEILHVGVHVLQLFVKEED